MNATWDCGQQRREDFTGRLTDAALTVTARHGVRGASVERELELWHSFGDVVRDTGCAPGREETLLAKLTDAAYRVALDHGTGGPFDDLELDLWRSLRRALAEQRLDQPDAPARASLAGASGWLVGWLPATARDALAGASGWL